MQPIAAPTRADVLHAPFPIGAFGDPPSEILTDSVVVCGVTIRIAGVAVTRDGESVTGSAGALDADPLPRAFYELTERLALLDAMRDDAERLVVFDAKRRPLAVIPRSRAFLQNRAPSAFRWARSSGVAIGDSFESAAQRARWELIERDRVLRSWYGDFAPVSVACGALLPAALDSLYDISAYTFDAGETEARVVGVFGFPKGDAPLVYGFAARDSLSGALQAAGSECLQRLGFLWGESLPSEPPPALPTAEGHQEYFLFPGHHERLRRWLSGGNSVYRGVLRAARCVDEPAFLDLTARPVRTTAVTGMPLRVAKAVPRGHVPLGFGAENPMLDRRIPPDLVIHPIA